MSKEDLPRFNAAVNSGLRARNSVAVEVTLLVLVYTVGLWMWRSHVALSEPTWYALPDKTHLHLTLAGYWYVFVSIPIFQFLLWRWYLRLGFWFRLLWQISRLKLRLSAIHPDRAGGIGFLGETSYAFGPILFAQGADLAGVFGNRILYDGQKLLSFKMEAIGLIAFIVLVILGPLLMFTPQLERTKFGGSADYGFLSHRYAFGFEEKWMRGRAPELTVLLGSADLQALADLGSSYSAINEMRIVPFGLKEITQLVAVTAVPFVPLAFTMFSANELLSRLLKIFF